MTNKTIDEGEKNKQANQVSELKRMPGDVLEQNRFRIQDARGQRQDGMVLLTVLK